MSLPPVAFHFISISALDRGIKRIYLRRLDTRGIGPSHLVAAFVVVGHFVTSMLFGSARKIDVRLSRGLRR